MAVVARGPAQSKSRREHRTQRVPIHHRAEEATEHNRPAVSPHKPRQVLERACVEHSRAADSSVRHQHHADLPAAQLARHFRSRASYTHFKPGLQHRDRALVHAFRVQEADPEPCPKVEHQDDPLLLLLLLGAAAGDAEAEADADADADVEGDVEGAV
eukprot:990557-Rhodomonas_salina.2